MVARALAEQQDASVVVSAAQYKVRAHEQAMAASKEAFEAAQHEITTRMVTLMAAKAAEVDDKLAKAHQWVEESTSDGIVFYWNPATNESTWEKPGELLLDEEVHKNRAWKQVCVCVCACMRACVCGREDRHL